MNEFPFTEDGTVRLFSATVHPEELQWHWDEEDRLVTPVHETDWMFQLDNELPRYLTKDVSVFISAGTWHRLLKGSGDLKLDVLKV